MRTTLDIDKPVLDELKKLQKQEKRSLGQLTSSLLAEVLQTKQTEASVSSSTELEWTTSRMGAKVDLSDKDALHRALDAS
ncbi:MAG TPA: hypothetical protein VJ952_09295 [Opitutales bacterium]|nr:hypothetical protein [Opitutales bacterium]